MMISCMDTRSIFKTFSASCRHHRLPLLFLAESRRSRRRHRFCTMQSSDSNKAQEEKGKNNKGLEIAGYSIEGLSIGGQETCIIVPELRMAFDIGRCPHRAISQEFLFISHGHMDHIGGLPMYVATRGLYKMRPPTIFVPADIKEHVEKLFEVHRAMDHSELNHNLIALNVGEDYQIRKDIIVKTFKTYHVIPSQGYIIYFVKNKLKKEYLGLPANDIKKLKFSGVEITDIIKTPEIAFTGDTMSDFIVDPNNIDALRARILIMETTFVDDAMSVEHARDYGHTHLSEVRICFVHIGYVGFGKDKRQHLLATT